MSSTDDLQPSPPEVSDATLAADVPDNLLNQLMDQHDAEQQLQNLQLQSGSGSQETGTEAAIPLQQGTGSPTSPISLTETMDDMDDTYAPTDDDDEEEDSTDSVEFIAETQVQEEEIQSTQLAPPQASQMLESHQESAAAPVRDSTEDLGDSEIDAEIERLEQQAARLRQLKAAKRARQDQGPEQSNVPPHVSPEQPFRERLRERLRERGMVETRIEADGNCQFRALADQLFDGDQERYAECRAAAINQLRSEPDRYREFITEDWETYVSRMENDREWGDNITLQAAADHYKVTAHVYSHDPEVPFPLVLPSKHYDADRIIRLSHKPEVHYNSVHPCSEATQQQERQRQEQGPEPRNVRPRVSPEQGRQVPRHRQGSIDPFVLNVRERICLTLAWNLRRVDCQPILTLRRYLCHRTSRVYTINGSPRRMI